MQPVQGYKSEEVRLITSMRIKTVYLKVGLGYISVPVPGDKQLKPASRISEHEQRKPAP